MNTQIRLRRTTPESLYFGDRNQLDTNPWETPHTVEWDTPDIDAEYIYRLTPQEQLTPVTYSVDYTPALGKPIAELLTQNGFTVKWTGSTHYAIHITL